MEPSFYEYRSKLIMKLALLQYHFVLGWISQEMGVVIKCSSDKLNVVLSDNWKLLNLNF